jgi:DNA-binding HxlR family transcriptional regulator
MEDARKIEIDRQRAEIFDALGHPTRILILKVLSEGSFGFAELKKKVGIESSGHLQHHLIKLNGLIKTDEYGKYGLTDEGKDALLTVQTVENTSSKYTAKQKNTYSKKPSFRGRTSLKQIAILFMALLFISSITLFYEFNQIANLESKNTFYENLNPWATEYYNQFGKVPLIYIH